jgi:zinc protease
MPWGPKFVRNGRTEAGLDRVKKALLPDDIYDCQSQDLIAWHYAQTLAIGRTLQDVAAWTKTIAGTKVDEIKRVGNAYLDERRSVTGWLLPEEGADLAPPNTRERRLSINHHRGTHMPEPSPSYSAPQRRATQLMLANGMEVVVIPDHRAPVVTHMVWYRVGAADGPTGVSGIAHFLEHLMFKSTENIADGAFAKIVMQLGGQFNAFTGQDFTAYFERVSKEQLRTMMEMEADRMVNLRLADEEVATERQVVIEERASRYDNNPSARLDEQMSAALYLAHPYRLPVIGWAHEIAKLSRQDALAFYDRYYAPNNAILVVSGDVTPEDLKRLAEETYGKIPANPGLAARNRPQDPPHEVARRISLEDKRVASAAVQRIYLVPSFTTAKGEAAALQLLMAIVGDSSTGRLHRKLVIEDKVAASAGGAYAGSGLDSGTISVEAVALPHRDLASVEAAIDAVLDAVRNGGVTALELERAKRSLRASHIFASDDQMKLAFRFGMALAVGRTLDEVETWPSELAKVTTDDIRAAACAHLDQRRSVTGWLLPLNEAPRPVTKAPTP